MDKFSELKAVAAKYSAAINAHRENPTDKGALYAWDEASSEFDRAINHNEMEIILALMAEIEALNIRAGQHQSVAANNLDMFLASSRRIAELETQLATPVRLPLLYSPDPWMSPDPDGTWLDKEDVKKSIRTAGFKVEEDA
jgi:hypothetical protein